MKVKARLKIDSFMAFFSSFTASFVLDMWQATFEQMKRCECMSCHSKDTMNLRRKFFLACLAQAPLVLKK